MCNYTFLLFWKQKRKVHVLLYSFTILEAIILYFIDMVSLHYNVEYSKWGKYLLKL